MFYSINKTNFASYNSSSPPHSLISLIKLFYLILIALFYFWLYLYKLIIYFLLAKISAFISKFYGFSLVNIFYKILL